MTQADSSFWRRAKSPAAAQLQILAEQCFASLPEQFRARAGGLVIHIEEFADDETLDALDIASPFDLMGLYQGAPVVHQSVMDPAGDMNRVFLYRRAILDYWAEHDETLEDLIRHILIHEIGHHFGLSDERMAQIEHAGKTAEGD